MTLLILWMLVGVIIWGYYMHKNHDDYKRRIKSGELSFFSFMRGYVLTIFLWPVTIYNQEFRKKS